MKTKTTILLAFLLFALNTCTSPFEKKEYRIGIEPDFFSLELDGMETNVYGFCNELFQEIAEEENVDFVFVKTSWDIIESGLKKESFEGMISGLPVYLRHEKTFDYSNLFLPTGPILVLAHDLKARKLSELDDRIIAVIANSKTSLLLDNYPRINMRHYLSIPQALNAVESGFADGALIPNLFAQNYVHNLYSQTLKIVGSPLTKAGLHLITLHEQNQDLLELFNNRLKEFQENGKLEEIMKRWKLTY